MAKTQSKKTRTAKVRTNKVIVTKPRTTTARTRAKANTEIDYNAVAALVFKELKLETNNHSQNDNIRSRMASLLSGGYDFGDTLHNIYLDYGYPAKVDFFNQWNMYRRFGIAKNIVELPPDVSWMTPPTINGSDQFNKEFEALVKQVKFWVRMKGLDVRQRVGRYAGMFMRVKDNLTPDMPIERGGLNGLSSLVETMPLYESQLDVIESDTNAMSETFGQPIMYQFSSGIVGSRNPDATSVINIHASRIVIAAEGADNGWIYGISSLEAPFNSLMDLRKIIGAGGEGFYKNAAQSIVFDLKDGASATQNEELLAKFNENYDEFARDRMRKSMWTPGMGATVLESSLANPKEHFMNALNDVAAASKIPGTLLIGQQTGRLASSEDSKNFLSVTQSRRENFLTEVVRDNIDWLIRFGILPASEYEVVWDDLLARSEDEKLGNASTMSEINEKQFRSGGEPVFSSEEIREAGGFDPEPEEDLGSDHLDDEDNEDEFLRDSRV